MGGFDFSDLREFLPFPIVVSFSISIAKGVSIKMGCINFPNSVIAGFRISGILDVARVTWIDLGNGTSLAHKKKAIRTQLLESFTW